EGPPDGIVANVFRPPGNEIAEASAVVGEQRACRLLKSGQVATDGGDEPVRRLLGSADAIAVATSPAGRIDKLPQRYRGSAGLNVQPVPVAGQQGHLAGDDAEAW